MYVFIVFSGFFISLCVGVEIMTRIVFGVKLVALTSKKRKEGHEICNNLDK